MSLPRCAAVAIAMLLPACASVRQRFPEAWLTVPSATPIRSVTLDAEGRVTHSPVPPVPPDHRPIRLERSAAGVRIMNGEKALTEPFPEIDSFDVSQARGEVVFSAWRAAGFDVGLVSTDGSPISWVPADPADEVAVAWAPRGHKVSYVVRAATAELVRTLHIPTALSLTVTLPHAGVHALSWNPQAERYAVAYSTPDASDRVEVLTYDGKTREMAVAPQSKIDAELEPLTKNALILRPRDLRYEERVPVVVWVSSEPGWNDARGALMKNARVAVVVTPEAPGEELWEVIEATPWLDEKVFVVDPAGKTANAPGRIVIRGDAALTGTEYVRSQGTVSVSPAVVQSFAAGFIADELKRISFPNGISR